VYMGNTGSDKFLYGGIDMRLSTIILMVFIILAFAGLSLTQTEVKRETSFKGDLHVGWARTDITPDRPVVLVGQPYKRISQRVRDPLTATALALETRTANGSIEQAIMVSCDVIYIRKVIQSRLREVIKSRITDFDPEKLFLNATHTHTAPGFVDWYGVSEDEDVMKASEYADYFVERVSKAVVEAWKNRKPGAMSWALGHAVIGMNRRAVYFDGSAAMYGATNKDNFSNIEGYEDHGVELLFFWNQDRKLTSLVVNIACPAQETEELSEISADFWHDVRIEFSRRISNDVFILPQCAAAGDISPHLLYRKAAEEAMRKRRGLSRRQEIARRITDAIEDVLPLAKKEVDSEVRFEHTVARIDIPSYDAKVLPSHNTNPVTPIEIHVIRLGDVSIATNPFELYLDYGIRMKARSPSALTFIVQTSCQLVDYLPTEKAVRGGGYSAEKPFVGPEGGQILVNETVRLLKKMWVEFTAASEGDSAAVQAFLEQGADVNARDQWERTALHYAAEKGHKEVVELLLEHGADVNARDQGGRTALQHSAEKGYEEVVELLLEHGADVNAKEYWDWTPLYSAADEGHKDIVELLITEGANVNARDGDRRTPLYYAAEKGHKEVVELLLDHGADVNAKDTQNRTALHIAARQGHKKIVGLLLAHGADVNAGANYNRTAAEFAMDNHHTEVAELLISKGADISPLHFAIYMKDEGKARSLIEGGADVNKRTPYGTTPLQRAVDCGFRDIVDLLITKGADVNAKDNGDWTHLHSAVYGHKDIVELLISKGANVNAKDGNRRTPLYYAKEQRHTEIVEMLKKHGAKE
jgi:ankyrin repeat protein